MAAGGSDNLNEQIWKMFLKPLTGHGNRQCHLTSFKEDQPFDSWRKRHLVEQMIKHLLLQQEKQNESKASKLTEKRNEIDQQRRVSVKTSFDDLLKAFKEYVAIESQKPDIKKSGSSWTLDMLGRYFELNVGYAFEFHFESVEFPDDEYSFNDIFMLEIKNVLQALGVSLPEEEEFVPVDDKSTGLEKLQDYSLLESSIRMILDSVLRSICRQARFNIILCTEQRLNYKNLPTNIFDYVLIFRDSRQEHVVVGFVEAKKPSSMDENAVAQLVIQLLSLSTLDPDSTYFGILSDGYRFIFVVVKENEMFFEAAENIDGNNAVILVREAKTWRDLDIIKQGILKLCFVQVKSSPSFYPFGCDYSTQNVSGGRRMQEPFKNKWVACNNKACFKPL